MYHLGLKSGYKLGTYVLENNTKLLFLNIIFKKWRKRRDSNPRDGSPPTPLAGERLRPLGHVSTDRFT